MNARRIARTLAWAAVGCLLLAEQAPAVIKVDLPLTKIYATAKDVAVGDISSVQADKKTVDVQVREALKGEFGPALRFIVEGPADLVPLLAQGMPVVLFAGRPDGQALVHVADGWLLARQVPDAMPPAWRIVGRHDIAKSFPGRTTALIQILAGLKKLGWTTLREGVSHEAFLAGVPMLGDLKVRPTCLAVADVDADGQLDLVVGTAGGAKLFLRTAEGFADATEAWGLAGAAAHAAAADLNGDNRPDLLVGPTVWINEGSRFRRVAPDLPFPPESEWLAVTLADATGDKRPDAVVLLASGKLITAANRDASGKEWTATLLVLWTDEPAPAAAVFSSHWGDDRQLHVMAVRPTGITRYPVGPTPGPPADFARLTGVGFDIYKDLGPSPLKILLAVAIDYDGNGQQDLMVVTEGGGITLANRGFGTFLINGWAHKLFHATPEKPLPETKPFPFRLTPATVAAPGRVAAPKGARRNLLVVTEEGKVYELLNGRP